MKPTNNYSSKHPNILFKDLETKEIKIKVSFVVKPSNNDETKVHITKDLRLCTV